MRASASIEGETQSFDLRLFLGAAAISFSASSFL